ncbi:ABC transporter transmembrane domain-containing protein [Streptomyces sp. NPDC021224]|uniref:ABC transporter transmembrane domain-containing protein n=1 Tax=unclassified Streptomyces TaxID=2593676 RepID=UPI0037B8758D
MRTDTQQPTDTRQRTGTRRPRAGPPASAGRLVGRSLRRNARGLAAVVALLSLWQFSEAMVPVAVGMIVDHAVASGSPRALSAWGGLLALVFASLMVCYFHGAARAFRTDQRERHRLRVEIARHVLRPAGARTGAPPGATLSLATADAEGAGTLAQPAGYTLASAAAVLGSAVILLRIDLVTGLVVLLGMPVLVALTQLATPALARRSRDQLDQVARTSALAADLVRGLRVLKGLGAEDEAVARYRASSQAARAAGIRLAASHGALEALSTGLAGLFLAAVTLLAGSRALDGTISTGDLVAIVGLTQFLAVPLRALGRTGEQVGAAHAAATRITAFLATPPLLAGGEEGVPGGGAAGLSLRDVTTGALDGFTLASRPGELLCLVVPDPAAADTLVRVLTGEIHGAALTGEVLLDGTPPVALGLHERTRRLLANPRHAHLLHGTLRGNLDPRGRHDGAALARALDAAAAQDIAALDAKGLDQQVTAGGTTYSGGQRQRLALARALAADPPVLLLDHPTTAVDAVTEQRIGAGIRALRHAPESDRTTWIVTTSPALLGAADRVVVVRDGHVTAEGTHRALTADPAYRDLVLR